MFDVGFTEILLIGVVALVVIGPERLPDVARTAGKWINKTQRFVRGVRADIANELDSGELKKLLGDQREQIDELRKIVGSTQRELSSSTREVMRGAKKRLNELESATMQAENIVDKASDDDVAAIANEAGGASGSPDADRPSLSHEGGTPSGQIDGQVTGDTSGSPHESPPADVLDEPSRRQDGTGA